MTCLRRSPTAHLEAAGVCVFAEKGPAVGRAGRAAAPAPMLGRAAVSTAACVSATLVTGRAPGAPVGYNGCVPALWGRKRLSGRPLWGLAGRAHLVGVL